jgi:hypothetical protein
MSEQNILNPAAGSVYSPDYGWDRQKSDLLRARMASGKIYPRRGGVQGRVWNFQWNKRLSADAEYLDQWAAQYEDSYFTIVDWDLPTPRYYTVSFTGPIKVSPAGHQQYNVTGQIEERAGKAVFQYPAGWGTDSIFIEEKDSEGNPLVWLTGAWGTQGAGNGHHGTSAYFSNTADNIAEWIYMGYGFRFWSVRRTDSGIVEISLDGTVLTTVDLYTPGGGFVVSSVLYTNASVNFGRHRVKLRVTGTKNAGATNFYCWADAIEVIP